MKILFVGNSHTYMNHMPEIVKMNASKEIEVFMLARGGITLRDHLNDPSFHFALRQDFDIVIIQQAAHDPCPTKKETLRDGKRMIELIKKYNKKVYILIPWPKEDDYEGFEVIKDIYDTLIQENGIEGIYAGYYVYDINHDISLYQKDHEHLNPLGSYVEACSVLYALFKQKTFKSLTLDYQTSHFKPYKINNDLSNKIEQILNREEKI